jgi:hypothetical protein
MLIQLKKVSIFSLIFSLLLIIALACSDNSTNPESPDIVLPGSNVTYSKHVGPLFAAKCAIPGGCHDTIDKAGGVNFSNVSTYPEIMQHVVTTQVGDFQLVSPGSSDNSFLYRILNEAVPPISKMPKNGPPWLNDNNLNGVKVWIDEGAEFE